MRVVAAVVVLASMLVASSSWAVPVQYNFQSGIVTLTASVGGVPIGAPVTADLDGIQVTVDEAAASGQLVSLELSAPGPIQIDFSPAYLGTHSSLVLEDLQLSGGPGDLIDLNNPLPDVNQYFFILNPFVVDATATLSGLPSVWIGGQSAASGELFISSSLNELSLSGITIGAISPAGPDVQPIQLKADFIFTGSAAAVPEPGAALLFAIGFATMAARRLRA